jgi:glycosyltransferase involved in cell wall biosynthesis
MKQPWLSVIIPTYNGEKYLSFALNSLIAQNQTDFECIVIDDGSTDSTISLLKSFTSKLPIRIINQARQGNWVINSNTALSEAKGDYVCFLHQDDLWLNNRLSIMKSLVTKFPDITFFLHPSVFIDGCGKYLGIWRCPLPHFPLITSSSTLIERLLIQNFISIPAPIFKRELALAVGGMDDGLWYTADWDFWLKIGAMGKVLYYPIPLTAFRIHQHSQTVRRSLSIDDFKKQMETVLAKHLFLSDLPEQSKLSIRKIGCFSIELNTALAAKMHDEKFDYLGILGAFLALGPAGCYKYLLNSRIWERVSSRLKALIFS